MSNDIFTADAPRPPKSNRGCLIAGIVGGGLLLVGLCCGGIFWFGMNAAGAMIEAELNTNPVVQEHVGTVNKASLNISESGAAAQTQPNAQVYDIQGTKANGTVTLIVVNNVISDGTLELDSGETFDLYPEAEEADADEAEAEADEMSAPSVESDETAPPPAE